MYFEIYFRILSKKIRFGNNNLLHQRKVEWNVNISLLSYFQSMSILFLVSSELMHQRQRVSDLEEELELLHKRLRSTQLKVIEQVQRFYLKNNYKEKYSFLQSQEIGNLKANKDVSDAQIAMFTDELLLTQVRHKIN